MTDQQISQLTNQFVKMMTCFDDWSPEQVRGLKIVLKRGEDYWDLKAIAPEEASAQKYALTMDFPELTEDKTDAMIELAGVISARLHAYQIGLKKSAARTPEARSRSAQKAVRARWAKKAVDKKQKI